VSDEEDDLVEQLVGEGDLDEQEELNEDERDDEGEMMLKLEELFPLLLPTCTLPPFVMLFMPFTLLPDRVADFIFIIS